MRGCCSTPIISGRVIGRVEDIAGLPPGKIRYVQVCDGLFNVPETEWIAESLEQRPYPGEGDFPLVAMVRHLPRDVPWTVECPSRPRMESGTSATAQALGAKAALDRLILEQAHVPSAVQPAVGEDQALEKDGAANHDRL